LSRQRWVTKSDDPGSQNLTDGNMTEFAEALMIDDTITWLKQTWNAA
jgi:hypothetical protein